MSTSALHNNLLHSASNKSLVSATLPWSIDPTLPQVCNYRVIPTHWPCSNSHDGPSTNLTMHGAHNRMLTHTQTNLGIRNDRNTTCTDKQGYVRHQYTQGLLPLSHWNPPMRWTHNGGWWESINCGTVHVTDEYHTYTVQFTFAMT